MDGREKNMTIAEKLITGVIGVALVTTLILPKRQTPQVTGAFFKGFANLLGTAMGTRKGY
jgi:hypothetical protein